MSPSGLEIRQLRAFVALADAKRVTAAAGALGLAQSTVSEALAALERSIGAPLVLRQRGGHGLELTEAGRALLPHARKILAAVNDAHVAMAATTSRARANVDIVANESVSSYLLPDILPMLRQRWPGTRFTVSVATCAGVRDGVASGAFDVGLLLAEPTADNRLGPRDTLANTVHRSSRGDPQCSTGTVCQPTRTLWCAAGRPASSVTTRSRAIRCLSAMRPANFTISFTSSSGMKASMGR